MEEMGGQGQETAHKLQSLEMGKRLEKTMIVDVKIPHNKILHKNSYKLSNNTPYVVWYEEGKQNLKFLNFKFLFYVFSLRTLKKKSFQMEEI